MAALFRQTECEDRVKILIASTPATGHLNPLLTIGRILIAEGHEVVGLSGSAFREPIEGIGAEFRPLPAGADFDVRDFDTVAPELKNIPPGLEWLRVAMERVFVDAIPAQHKGLQQVLRDFPADVIIGDDMIFGVHAHAARTDARSGPPLCFVVHRFCTGAAKTERHILSACRLQPPRPSSRNTQPSRKSMTSVVNRPVGPSLESVLGGFGCRAVVDASFRSRRRACRCVYAADGPEFRVSATRHPAFGAFHRCPSDHSQSSPLPVWADELDGSRKVVLVTQGTLANHNFGCLIAPTLAALANEPDLLVVVTAGAVQSTPYRAQFPATRAWPAICRSNGCCRRSTCLLPTAVTAASTRL